MITKLRRRHRWMAPVVFSAAAVLFTAGILARPDAAAIEPQAFDAEGLPHVRIEPGIDCYVDRARSQLVFVPEQPIEAPDLLVYALSEIAPSGGDLPAGARLLGTIANSGVSRVQCDEPPLAVAIYSLGHATTIATAVMQPEFR